MSEDTPSLECAECGHADEARSMPEALAALEGFGRRYRAPLTRFLPGEDGDAMLRERPAPDVWSALEYAAHVRDVFAWYEEWVRRALVEDEPVVVVPTPDEAAELGGYNEADPAEVVEALAANAAALAITLAGVPEEAWGRSYVRRGLRRSVLLTARRAMHEGNHHLLDIGRGMRAIRQRNREGA